jgi:hypothetical protein
MNFSSTVSQALSAPPYLVSFILVLLVAYLSDRTKSRAHFIILASLLGAGGYAFLAVAGHMRMSSWLRYASVYPAAAGFFVAITLIITWTLNNQASDEGKGTGVAMLNVRYRYWWRSSEKCGKGERNKLLTQGLRFWDR